MNDEFSTYVRHNFYEDHSFDINEVLIDLFLHPNYDIPIPT